MMQIVNGVKVGICCFQIGSLVEAKTSDHSFNSHASSTLDERKLYEERILSSFFSVVGKIVYTHLIILLVFRDTKFSRFLRLSKKSRNQRPANKRRYARKF